MCAPRIIIIPYSYIRASKLVPELHGSGNYFIYKLFVFKFEKFLKYLLLLWSERNFISKNINFVIKVSRQYCITFQKYEF